MLLKGPSDIWSPLISIRSWVANGRTVRIPSPIAAALMVKLASLSRDDHRNRFSLSGHPAELCWRRPFSGVLRSSDFALIWVVTRTWCETITLLLISNSEMCQIWFSIKFSIYVCSFSVLKFDFNGKCVLSASIFGVHLPLLSLQSILIRQIAKPIVCKGTPHRVK